MTYTNKSKFKTEAGFALLITLIVVSVVISVGLTLLDITIKQLRLASGSKDSETSFHAANAGVECARYWRRKEQTKFESGAVVTLSCFGQTNVSTVVRQLQSPSAIYEYTFEFNSGTGISSRCSKVKMITLSSEPNAPLVSGNFAVVLNNVNTAALIPGFPEATKGCQPGGRCTIISSQGYNKDCSSTNIIGTIQREVLLEL